MLHMDRSENSNKPEAKIVELSIGPIEISLQLKGTVSPDIELHFSFWKIKLVLSAGPLMVLTFFFFVVPEIFKY
jgi:hypothetical protein